jgi:hypothetical protein
MIPTQLTITLTPSEATVSQSPKQQQWRRTGGFVHNDALFLPGTSANKQQN